MQKINTELWSLKAKMALVATLITGVVLLLQTLLQIFNLREELRNSIDAQQTALVTRIADDLDDKLATRFTSIQRTAKVFPLDLLHKSPSQISLYLNDRIGLQALFDELAVIDIHNQVVQTWPNPYRGHHDVLAANSDFTAQVIATGKPAISRPFMNALTHQPALLFVSPLQDQSGQIHGAYVGLINLFRPNILGELRTTHIGERGYFYLIDPQDRNTIMHPSASRVMTPYTYKGTHPGMDKAIAGFEGTVETQADQENALLSFKRVETTGWILTAVFPVEEAFYPIDQSRRRTIWTAILLGMLIAPLIWFLSEQTLAPLEQLATEIRRRFAADGSLLTKDRVPVQGSTEIRRLALAFNEFLNLNTQAEQALVLRERHLAQVLETATDGIWEWDIQTGAVQTNKAFAEMFGFEPAQPLSLHQDDIQRRLHPVDKEKANQAMIECLKGGVDAYRSEHRMFKNDLTVLWIQDRGRVTERNAQGRAIRMIGSFTDITAIHQREEQIRRLAYFDALTNLPNRPHLEKTITEAIQRANQQHEQIALLFMDLDHFKHVNDSLGHFTGDQLLREVGLRLTKAAGNDSYVSRLGGDEFVVVLEHCTPALAEYTAKQIQAQLSVPYDLEGRSLLVTPSIGVSFYPDDADNFETLLRHADLAMYAAKERGRNDYCLFDIEMNQAAHERLQIEEELHSALENQELSLHYQPQVDIYTGKIIGAEALLRWQRSDGSMVPPFRFIPVAEECGLINPIGEWVIQQACQQAKAWQDAGLPKIVIAVNLSAIQFRQKRLFDIVHQALEHSGLEPGWLELEITEGALMEDTASAVVLLERLKQLGINLAIDDFGTGYSSMGYLKHFPVDKLKIDRSFVMELMESNQDRAIAQAVIALGHCLGLKVIAEGVEEEHQLDILRNDLCDEYQGYYFSRPLPPQEFVKLLSQSAKNC